MLTDHSLLISHGGYLFFYLNPIYLFLFKFDLFISRHIKGLNNLFFREIKFIHLLAEPRFQ
jgi:hypothetical protein